jgi:orotidine-5'-phosphate decarboxylase
MAAPQTMRLIDAPSVNEIYANKLINTAFDGATVSLTLGTTRLLTERVDQAPDQGQTPTVHVTARVALSPSAAIELVNALTQLLNALKQRAAQATATAAPPAGSPPKTDA